jgi:(1->4)-alpha-D-glucan 1-alpha-D-glucosylmutase
MSGHPGATYRLQLGPDLDLAGAAGLVDYLSRLGVTHVYLSPILEAAPGATHGYAVVDHNRVDDRLGGEAGRSRLTEATTGAGLGIVLDLVPNHMAVSLPSNRWFWDVLQHGPASRYAPYFDVDWDPPESATRNKVLLPVLGDHYGRELEAGALEVVRRQAVIRVRYHDHLLPASPRSVATVMAAAARSLDSDRLAFVARSLAALPPAVATDAASRHRRQTDADVLAEIVTEMVADPTVAEAIDEAVTAVNEDADALDAFLELQHYRLARWRVAGQELGYRRFFDIDDLIGLRVEDPEVFADSHALVLQWVRAGEADGLRIDHPDGLRRPTRYLRRLREAAPQAWIVVEKILEGDETLPSEWPVEGTTGYEFLNDVTALLVDPDGEAPLTRLWDEVSESTETWETVAETSKRDVLRDVLGADLNRLANLFARVVEGRRRYRDFTRTELSEALAETLVAFEVYRTYVSEEGDAEPVDLARIEGALDRARDGAPDLDPELFEVLGKVLTGLLEGETETGLRMRFQQLSGPVMAKGVEDTAFYRYLRMAALCEVGGDPGRFGMEPEVFHHRLRQRQAGWPETMLALSTHDTKRSEDVRARLAVLSEIPEIWTETVRSWREMARSHRSDLVDGATEYLIYQTLVGAHPIGADRLLPYLEKATKEAKTHTSWTDPDPDYDAAVAGFAAALLSDEDFMADLQTFLNPFGETRDRFRDRIARHGAQFGRENGRGVDVIGAGRINSLTQKTIQLTAPGVPDIYQGSELWDLSLVDPDNRRPVDYGVRREMLKRMEDADAATILTGMEEGLPKLWVTETLLGVRRRRPEAFDAKAAYRPLQVTGDAEDHAVAFARGGEVVIVVPRLVVRLEKRGGWGATRVEVPPGEWGNVFTGEPVRGGTVEVARLLADFPVAVLERR